jgi:hypothetical protein
MLSGGVQLPPGLSMRPARPSDSGFIENLFNSTRDDLRLIDAEADFIEAVIDQQYHAQTVGYGEMYPNAMYFIVEMHQERVGRVVVDFGADYVDIVDISFIRPARGKGYVTGVIQALQMAAAKVRAPLYSTLSLANAALRQTYVGLGFATQSVDGLAERLVWFPAPLS